MQLWQVLVFSLIMWTSMPVHFVQSSPFTYIEPASYRELPQSSSLPSRYGERVIRSPEGGEPRPLPGFLVVIARPYKDVRDRIRGQVRTQFGEGQYSEDLHDDLIEYGADAGEDSEGFYKDREVKSRLLLDSESIRATQYHETRVITLPYNTAWWKPSSSQAVFRIIDGHDIFQTPSTLIVVKRMDRELVIGFLHGLGVPLPTVGMRARSLVTDKELAIVDRVTGELKADCQWYPFWGSSLLANANMLVSARKAQGLSRKPDISPVTIPPVR